MYGQALPYLGGSTSGQVHGDSFQAVTTTTANGFHPLALLPSTRLPTAQATQTITSRSWLEHRPLTRCHCRCPPFNGTWLYVTANPPFTLYFSGFADADTLASLNPQRIQRHIRMDRTPMQPAVTFGWAVPGPAAIISTTQRKRWLPDTPSRGCPSTAN